MSVSPTILWFRQDLRLADNAALTAAIARGGPVVPVYILDIAGEERWAPGAASRWWLHHSLVALGRALEDRGSRLILAKGDSRVILTKLVGAIGAGAVYWNRRYEPSVIARDSSIKAGLIKAGIDAKSFNSALLFEPQAIANKQGGPFQVFTPYWRHCQSLPWPDEVKGPRGEIPPPPSWPESAEVGSLMLLPSIPWDRKFHAHWTPGEAGARTRLKSFFVRGIESYSDRRDQPAADGGSRLSPHLHFGEIGPRQIVAGVRKLSVESGVFPSGRGAAKFLDELGWREFGHHLLFHFPDTPEKPRRPEFARFPWSKDPGNRHLRAWQKGRTGYPIVDAGMRELWATGWMHNRVRMVAASFLVKHLLLPWGDGARWFWDTLVDADLANNTLGWQWSAGCGADAAPYFRIFAPVLQGEKFDHDGDYVRRWVPEIAGLPDAFLQKPWEAPAHVLERAAVVLGKTYPLPIVDHAEARAAALAAYKSLRVAVQA